MFQDPPPSPRVVYIHRMQVPGWNGNTVIRRDKKPLPLPYVDDAEEVLGQDRSQPPGERLGRALRAACTALVNATDQLNDLDKKVAGVALPWCWALQSVLQVAGAEMCLLVFVSAPLSTCVLPASGWGRRLRRYPSSGSQRHFGRVGCRKVWFCIRCGLLRCWLYNG